MSTDLAPLNPLTVFDDNLRPAQLMLQVYRLLDANDTILSSGEMVETMRGVIKASTNEELMLVYNELFLGLVRERAQMPPLCLASCDALPSVAAVSRSVLHSPGNVSAGVAARTTAHRDCSTRARVHAAGQYRC
jgi:hypothetical protein